MPLPKLTEPGKTIGISAADDAYIDSIKKPGQTKKDCLHEILRRSKYQTSKRLAAKKSCLLIK